MNASSLIYCCAAKQISPSARGEPVEPRALRSSFRLRQGYGGPPKHEARRLVDNLRTSGMSIPIRLNLASYLLDARIAEGRGDRIAIRTGERTFSYADVARRSGQIAQLLVADDVRPEERVIVALPDGVDFVAALFGILRRGS